MTMEDLRSTHLAIFCEELDFFEGLVHTLCFSYGLYTFGLLID